MEDLPAIPYGTMASIWVADTYSIGAGILSKRTCVSASTFGTVSFCDALIASAGPRFAPKMEMISPGAIAPGTKLAALAMIVGTGTGRGAITYLTLIACGLFAAPSDVKVISPVYVPGASPFGLTEMVKFAAGLPADPTGGVTASQLPPGG